MAIALKFTKAGRLALINEQGTGTAKTKIISAGITTTSFVFDEDMTVLPNELKRITAIGGIVLDRTLINLSIKDETSDAYALHGLGLYLEDGTLLAVSVQTTPILEKSNATSFLGQFDIVITDGDIDISNLEIGDINFTNPHATEIVEGIARIATKPEAEAQADDTTIMTPKKVGQAILKNVPVATTERAGIARIATLEEALSGTLDGNVLITPQTLEQALLRRGLPIGSYVMAPFDTPPAGCLRCNAALLLKTDYPDLYKKIGGRYGENTTHFRVPEVRGEFPRFWDDGRGIDTGRVLGSWQQHMLGWHEHGGETTWNGEHGHGQFIPFYTENSGSAGRNPFAKGNPDIYGGQFWWETAWSGPHKHAFTTYGVGGNETRPRNIAIACFIYAYYPRS